jgi:Asp/Glu/hydantoin racemase
MTEILLINPNTTTSITDMPSSAKRIERRGARQDFRR